MRLLLVLVVTFCVSYAQAADFQKIDLPTEADINAIHFDGDFLGWAATSEGELLSTHNGGQTWKLKEVNPREILDIHIVGKFGYLCGDKGLLMKTTNRGATWEDISLSFKFRLTGVAIVNDSVVMVCGTDQNSISKTKGVVYRSTDYGKTWEKQPHLGHGYQDIEVSPPKKVYLLAIKKAFHSISEGWEKGWWEGEYSDDRLGFDFDLIDAWGYLVGLKGLLAKTIDHGRNWTPIALDLKKHLFGVSIFDKSSGVAVGEDGVAVFFSDFGENYTILHTGFDADLLTVETTSSKIFCGGDNGTMLVMDRK